MNNLQCTDHEMWQTFTSLGVDHALKQENRTMKIMGGLRGLTYRPAALTRFFLVAPELERLSGEADAMVGFTKRPAQHHHQLSEAVTRRQERMIKKIRSILEESNPFKHDGDDLVNSINKTVIPEHMKIDIHHTV